MVPTRSHVGQPVPLPTDMLALYDYGIITSVTSQVDIDLFSVLVNRLTQSYRATL